MKGIFGEQMNKIGIFGGTFNPIHNGHVHLLTHYLKALDLDKILVIPTKFPPHKEAENLVSTEMRLEMCKLAVTGIERVEVSDIELLRSGKSYTIDTIEELSKKNPEALFYLLVGSDMFLEFQKWREWEKILSKVILCTASRHNDELNLLYKIGEKLSFYGKGTRVFDFEALPMSSTQIRERLIKGMDCDSYLPLGVSDYILKNSLYCSKN